MDKLEQEYNSVLNSGMFWEFHPELSGNYELDKAEWNRIKNTPYICPKSKNLCKDECCTHPTNCNIEDNNELISGYEPSNVELGSKTAKDGFLNEKLVVEKFMDWQNDTDVEGWLLQMGYDLNEIEYVTAETLHGYKTDVQVQVTIKLKNLIDAQNLQVKLVSNPKGFNQVDKRWVDTYQKMWNIPENITTTLKHYTGELPPTIENPKDDRRMFTDEMEFTHVLDWFRENKFLIISDIMKGRGKFAAEWILVALNVNDDVKWLLEPMNVAMNHFSQGDVTTTSQGNFKIGRITVQRKGGDAGRDTAKMLQFKLNPAELFYL